MDKYRAAEIIRPLGGPEGLDVENLALGRITRLIVEYGIREHAKVSHLPLDLFLADFLNDALEAARVMRPDLQHH